MNYFETMHPKIDEHLKTEEGRAVLMRTWLEYLDRTQPVLMAVVEATLPKPVSPPVSPNSNPSLTNA